jgi:hypothetical protein
MLLCAVLVSALFCTATARGTWGPMTELSPAARMAAKRILDRIARERLSARLDGHPTSATARRDGNACDGGLNQSAALI